MILVTKSHIIYLEKAGSTCAEKKGAATMRCTRESIICDIMQDLNCTEEQAIIVYNKAFELGHSGGMSDVQWYASEICETIKSFLSRR